MVLKNKTDKKQRKNNGDWKCARADGELIYH